MRDYMYKENIDDFPVAMAYVPWQHFKGICENLEQWGKLVAAPVHTHAALCCECGAGLGSLFNFF